MIFLFWLLLAIIFYTFFGYGILLYILNKLKGRKKPVETSDLAALPACTLIIAAYNEERIIKEKVENCLKLNYPEGKLSIMFVSDGSSDSTASILSNIPEIIHHHSAARQGKMAAIDRVVPLVKTPLLVFTDANTFLNPDTLIKLNHHFLDDKVGAVAGEKRIIVDKNADASSAGEGIYWKYESFLKKQDAQLFSAMGCAGELYAIRKSLHKPQSADTILDDFMVSMEVLRHGKVIAYEPDAFALEYGSENTTEELKRKIRISAGAWQSMGRTTDLMNPFKYPLISFLYISHRILRWSVTPISLLLFYIVNTLVLTAGFIYQLTFVAQTVFYILSFIGYLMARKQIKFKAFFIPYYFTFMNYAAIAGAFRYFNGKQSAVWEKAKRK